MSAVGDGAMAEGRVRLDLAARSLRPDADSVIRARQPRLAVIPGVRVYLSVPPVIRIGGRPTKSLYQFTLQSPDMEVLYPEAAKLESKLRALPGLLDVTSDLQIKNPQVSVSLDRDRAAALGVTANDIEHVLFEAFGSSQVSTIYTPNHHYWVIMEPF